MGTDNERMAILETTVQTIKSDIHTLYKKTDEISQIATALALLTASVNDLKSTVCKLNDKLDVTSNTPTKEKAKLWDTIVKNIIVGVIALGMGYIGVKLGLSK